MAEIYFLRMTLLFNDGKIIIEKKVEEPTVVPKEEPKEEEVIEVVDSVNEQKEEKESKIEKYTQNEENVDINSKKITINNVLFGANKDLKTEFVDKYVNINDYITDKKYNSLANLMVKATPEVVSDKIVLFSFKNSFEVVLFDKNIDDIVKLLKLIYKQKFEIVAISEEEWKEEKNEYIKNIKSGVKYSYIEEKKKGTSAKKKTTELENSIENVFGDDFIVED